MKGTAWMWNSWREVKFEAERIQYQTYMDQQNHQLKEFQDAAEKRRRSGKNNYCGNEPLKTKPD